MQLSIITPLFNRLDLTRACLESLRRTLDGWDYEWILIDDGSTDGTREFLRELPEDGQVRVVLNDSPRGYAANNNLGARLARSPLLCLLNNDTVLLPGWVEPMARLARLLPDVACVGNIQREPVSGLIDHAGIYFDLEGYPHHAAKGEPFPPREDYLRWPAVTAACCVIRKEVFLGQGGFDESFRNGSEDVDFCLRVGTRGYRHFVANRSVIYHHVSASPGRMRHEEENRQLFRKFWLTHFQQGLREPRTRTLERVVGREYLRKHRWRPWKYNFWRFCRSLEQLLSTAPPSRQLDIAVRLLFGWQDFLRRRRVLQSKASEPAAEPSTPIYVVVGNTARTAERTGVQTFARNLVAAFGRMGAPVRLVVWRASTRSLCLLPSGMSVGLDAETLRPPPLAALDELTAASLYEPSMGDLHDVDAEMPSLHELPAGQSATQDGAWILLPEVLYGGQAGAWVEYVRRHGWNSAVILYDTMPNNEPHFFPLKVPSAHEAYLSAISGADRVFPVSRFVADDWRRFLKAKQLPETKPKVWKPGADGLARTRATTAPSRVAAAPVRVLCVSSLEPRKNLRRLLEAYDLIAAEHPKLDLELCLVGKPHLFNEDNVPEAVRLSVERHGGKVRWLEAVEYSALAKLYEACDFTVYPSLLEGSALPILESLWFRRPCICANTGVMKEAAAGGGCLTVDVYHAKIIAGAILSLAESRERLAELAAEIERRPLRTALSEVAVEIGRRPLYKGRAKLAAEIERRPLRTWEQAASELFAHLQPSPRSQRVEVEAERPPVP